MIVIEHPLKQRRDGFIVARTSTPHCGTSEREHLGWMAAINSIFAMIGVTKSAAIDVDILTDALLTHPIRVRLPTKSHRGILIKVFGSPRCAVVSVGRHAKIVPSVQMKRK